MSKEKIITIYVDDDKKKVVIDFLESLNLTFEIKSTSEYDSNKKQSFLQDEQQILLSKNKTKNIDSNDDWWHELSPKNKAMIEKGILQLENSEGVADSKVRDKVNKLFKEHEKRN